MIDPAQLQPLVEHWLPSQRWFGGKGRSARVQVAQLAELSAGPPAVEVWTADVTYDDGSTETYQMPLVARTEPSDSLEHVQLGTVDTDNGPAWVYDALHDKDLTRIWLSGVQSGKDVGSLRFHRYVDAADIPVDEPSLVLTGEQSNTSLVYGDLAIVKVFRRLQVGLNPDIEVHAALGKLGGRHVAKLLGSVEQELDGDVRSLAMVQEFLTTATDGWESAKASVRDLFAEGDLHAEEAGGDFAGEACRLGQAIAEIHQDLATAFGTDTAGADDIARRAHAMHARLDAAIDVVPQLGDLAGGLRAAFDAFAEHAGPMAVQRIHGDLHLGQALRTVHRWVVIDFEGEPMAELAARRLPDSPLRDIAGMLRSFDYAGHHRLVEGAVDSQLSYRATEWSERNRDAFCTGYSDASGNDPRQAGVVLRAFEADKAVYEAVYEARNRPTWLAIPLASLTRLAETEGVS